MIRSITCGLGMGMTFSMAGAMPGTWIAFWIVLYPLIPERKPCASHASRWICGSCIPASSRSPLEVRDERVATPGGRARIEGRNLLLNDAAVLGFSMLNSMICAS